MNADTSHDEKATRVVAAPHGAPSEFALEEVHLLAPEGGQVQVAIRAAGLNPADLGMLAGAGPREQAQPMGFEGAGVITALGPDASSQQRPLAVGDEVIVYLTLGSFASKINAPAADVFPKPAALSFPAAANLFLVGLTAAEMLQVTQVVRGETLLVHGASGATGVSAIQQARLLGARVIGTASQGNFELLRSLGAEPVAYGVGLEERVRQIAPEGVAAALDCVGTEEALVTSAALVADRARIVSIANPTLSAEMGVRYIVGSDPASHEYRNSQRERILALAARGELAVPVARTFPLAQAEQAFELIRTGHPGGKLALIP